RVADLQLDYETTETTRSLGSKSNTQILGLTRDTQILGIRGRNIFSYVSTEGGIPPSVIYCAHAQRGAGQIPAA
ncbi:hypothetical protein ACNDQR_003854, partial [Escherichia coli]|uniref:hypothetical protein n=1 Tax=Escherichia coli TaxID=562 RepID=UPI001ABD16F0